MKRSDRYYYHHQVLTKLYAERPFIDMPNVDGFRFKGDRRGKSYGNVLLSDLREFGFIDDHNWITPEGVAWMLFGVQS